MIHYIEYDPATGEGHEINPFKRSDLVAVVRCRDCYFAEEIEGGYWCDRFGNGKEHVTPDGFCSWGKRRDD